MSKWILFLCTFQTLFAIHPPFITYELSGGRFGDNLHAYLNAKWISYKYQMPLIYQPFEYSSQLTLHHKEISNSFSKRDFKFSRIKSAENILISKLLEKKIIINENEKINLQQTNQAYSLPYYSEDWELPNFITDPVDWKNPGFRNLALRMIQPQIPIELIIPPQNSINIAIHFRDGGIYFVDSEDVKFSMPAKFPPITFYIEGLTKIIHLFPGKPIYCFIFTDALDPERIVNLLKASIPDNGQIVYDYREPVQHPNPHHNENVLEDFFSLFNFDILIRPLSNFSLVPKLLHDYAIIYQPSRCHVEENQIVVEDVSMQIDQSLYEILLHR